jgi:hypothetical protein
MPETYARIRLRTRCRRACPQDRADTPNLDYPVVLIAAFVILSVAVLLGIVLAVQHLRSAGAVVSAWVLAGIHGLLAIGGFGCLLLALGGPPRGLATGTASFGKIAAVLIALAALVGGVILTTHFLKRQIPGIMIGIHATLAVSGFVFLATYILLG